MEKRMTTYPSTPIAYASYPDTGIVRTDRKFRATIQFYTGSAWGRGVWACSKTFSNEAHVDNFIAYMKRKKGWNVDEVSRYGRNASLGKGQDLRVRLERKLDKMTGHEAQENSLG